MKVFRMVNWFLGIASFILFVIGVVWLFEPILQYGFLGNFELYKTGIIIICITFPVIIICSFSGGDWWLWPIKIKIIIMLAFLD